MKLRPYPLGGKLEGKKNPWGRGVEKYRLPTLINALGDWKTAALIRVEKAARHTPQPLGFFLGA